MSLNLHAPDEARARPGTYLNKEVNYQRIFPEGGGLRRYLVAAELERKVENWLRENRKAYESLYRNNLRFHTIMVLSWVLIGQVSKKTENLNLNELKDSKVKQAFEWVVKQYKKKGGQNDKLSKSKDFTKFLIQSWPKKPKPVRIRRLRPRH